MILLIMMIHIMDKFLTGWPEMANELHKIILDTIESLENLNRTIAAASANQKDIELFTKELALRNLKPVNKFINNNNFQLNKVKKL